MVAEVDAATAVVVIVNGALLAPAGTVTLPGTVAAGLLLDSVTGAPPAGAGPFSVTVPVELLPPVTVVGFTPSEETTGGGPPSVLVRGPPLLEAVMVVAAAAAVPPRAPAAGWLLDGGPGAPPAGAGPSSVAVPVELLPPVTVVGFTPSGERRTAGFTMRVAVRVTPL